MNELTINTCQGIGDIFWVYRKVFHHCDTINFNICCLDLDTLSKRSISWIKDWPKVKSVQAIQVTNMRYHHLIACHHSLKDLLDGKISDYAVNYDLEQGVHLDDIDDYKVAWDIELPIEPLNLPYKDYFLLYVSGSLYYWKLEDWIQLIKLINPKLPIIIIGALWDQKVIQELRIGLMEYKIMPYVDLPPKYVSHIIKNAKFFLSYQSGLGIIADHYNVNQCMIYFPQYNKLMYSWCKKEHIRTKFHGITMQNITVVSKMIEKLLSTS